MFGCFIGDGTIWQCRRRKCHEEGCQRDRTKEEARMAEEQTPYATRARGDKPAFAHGDPTHGGDPGMTLREYYAGLAMQGLMIDFRVYDDAENLAESDRLVRNAVWFADALIEALERSR